MREADMIPACFELANGPFDVEEVESFFSARRDVLLAEPPKGREAEPLIPLHKLPVTVQKRWFEYLAQRAANVRPLNGIQPSTGKVESRYFDTILQSSVQRMASSRPDIEVTVTKVCNETPSDVTKPIVPVTSVTIVTKPSTGRPAIGDAPMTSAERVRAYREKQKKKLTEEDLQRALEDDSGEVG